MPPRSRTGAIASAKTKAEFSDRLSSLTSLTADEVSVLFPSRSDRDELVELLGIVEKSTSDNESKAQLIERIDEVSGAVVKVARRFFGLV